MLDSANGGDLANIMVKVGENNFDAAYVVRQLHEAIVAAKTEDFLPKYLNFGREDSNN